MKKLLLLSVLFTFSFSFLTFNCLAQTPNWQWAKGAGGSLYDEAMSVTMDVSGNIIYTGYFNSDTITFGSTTLTSTGESKIFIVKYDSSGNVLWAKSSNGQGNGNVSDIITDCDDNIIITGCFNGTSISFDTITLFNSNSSRADLFITKYDSAGNVVWARSAGGWDYDYGVSINTDVHNNIFLLGSFYSDTIKFGSTTLINNSIFGDEDIFLSKYDKSGNVIWARSFGGTYNDGGNCITNDNDGNIIITGSFLSPSITFDTITLIKADNNIYSGDVYIAKFDSLGNAIWAERAGGAYGDVGAGVVTDKNNNIYLTGGFQSDTLTFGTISLINTGGYDSFLAKFDNSGNVLWARNSNSIGDDFGISITKDTAGNPIIAGYFNAGTIRFGTSTLTNSNMGYDDIYIVKYDKQGTITWSKSFGGSDYDYITGLSSCRNNDILITGYYASPSITFGSSTITNEGNYDLYCAKLSATTGSIKLFTNGKEISFYPNPAVSNITIVTMQHSEIEISNIQGQLIKTIATNEGKTNVDVSAFPSGVYVVEVKTNKGVAVKKFIKE
jgi:hypothetical protein